MAETQRIQPLPPQCMDDDGPQPVLQRRFRRSRRHLPLHRKELHMAAEDSRRGPPLAGPLLLRPRLAVRSRRHSSQFQTRRADRQDSARPLQVRPRRLSHTLTRKRRGDKRTDRGHQAGQRLIAENPPDVPARTTLRSRRAQKRGLRCFQACRKLVGVIVSHEIQRPHKAKRSL